MSARWIAEVAAPGAELTWSVYVIGEQRDALAEVERYARERGADVRRFYLDPEQPHNPRPEQ